MNKTASISLKIDQTTKSIAENIYKSLGISLADAINIFLKRSIAEGGLPFDLKLHKFNSTTEQTIEKVNKGEDLYGPFDTIEEVMEELNV